nr:metallophosphoesterase [uncultured Gellertiella sp.]
MTLLLAGVFAFAAAPAARSADPAAGVTFLFASDMHACLINGGMLAPKCQEEGKTDQNLLRNVAAMNSVETLAWPSAINGQPTGLANAGKPIGKPMALVVGGDITDDGGGQLKVPGEGRQLQQFASRYSEGMSPDHVHFPVYVGLGNHDLDQDGTKPNRNWYRREMRDYVELNHRSTVFYKAPLPAENYDVTSDCYSFDMGPVHLVQMQRYGGDSLHGSVSCLDWLKDDLANYAANGKPVVLFQHYGWDDFSIERWDKTRHVFDDVGTGKPHWWSDQDRAQLIAAIRPYNVVGLFHGHQHATPMIYNREGIDIIKPVAAFMGGFAVVNITGTSMDVVLAEANPDGTGVEFTNAFSKRILAGK